MKTHEELKIGDVVYFTTESAPNFDSSYLTPRKRYRIIAHPRVESQLPHCIKADDGQYLYVILGGCAHLTGGEWMIDEKGEATTKFAWESELKTILFDYKEADFTPLDIHEVDRLVEILKVKINLIEGNITEDEYHELLK